MKGFESMSEKESYFDPFEKSIKLTDSMKKMSEKVVIYNPFKDRINRRDSLVKNTDGNKTVAIAQASLIMAGYDLGKAGVDGIQGEKTTKAIIQFQNAMGLTPTGKITLETVRVLTMVTAMGLNKTNIDESGKYTNNELTLISVNGINYIESPAKGGGPLMESRAAADFKKAMNELKQKKFDVSKLQFTDMFRSHEKQEHFKEAKRSGNQKEINTHGLHWKVAEVSPHELGAGFDIGNLQIFDQKTQQKIIDAFVNNGFIWEGNKDPVHFTWGKIDKSKINIIQSVWKNKWEQKYGAYNCELSK